MYNAQQLTVTKRQSEKVIVRLANTGKEGHGLYRLREDKEQGEKKL